MSASPMTLATLQRRYVVVAGMRWLPIGMIVPVIVVLLGARGLPIATIGPLLAAYSAVVILLELPTGGLADRHGRRRIHLLASAVAAVGMLIFGLATSTAMFLASMLPQGIARALASGPLEAWFVDEAHRIDPEAVLDGAFARAEAVAALALGAGALLTALLPQVVTLPESGSGLIAPSLPVLLSVIVELLHLAVAWRLMRPDGPPAHDTAGASDTAGAATPSSLATLIRSAIRTARGPVLRRVLIAEAGAATALVVTEQVSPTDLVRLLGERDATSLFATLAAVGFGVVAIGARVAPALSARWGPRRTYAVAITLVALGVAVGGLGAAVPIGLGYLVVYLALGLRSPVRASLLHQRVDSGQRATVLSVTSLVFQLGGLVASLAILPVYAATSPAVGFLGPAAVVLVAAVVLGRPVEHEG